VLKRLDAFLRRKVRAFTEQHELRASPRGRVRWSEYAGNSIPHGRWHRLPCVFTEPSDDPVLMAHVRWTIRRVVDSIGELAPTPVGRRLIELARTLELMAGPGPLLRPTEHNAQSIDARWLAEALEAMGWVSDERGLGGARTLDGLAWDLSVDQVWEHWVGHVVSELGGRLGLSFVSSSEARHALQWSGDVRSMSGLIPDAGLRGFDRTIWVDAKYKAHLLLLARKSWSGLSEDVRDAHRADIHQALAYAALAKTHMVDTVLAYPVAADEEQRIPVSVATVVAGTQRVRLHLAALPFGFRSPSHKERVLSMWREILTRP
jgi:5-methylcytosine-specific restriction endonuclease McrBC regulatory subunit McrC